MNESKIRRPSSRDPVVKRTHDPESRHPSGDLQRGQTGTSDQDGEGSDLGDQGGDSQAGKDINGDD